MYKPRIFRLNVLLSVIKNLFILTKYFNIFLICFIRAVQFPYTNLCMFLFENSYQDRAQRE